MKYLKKMFIFCFIFFVGLSGLAFGAQYEWKLGTCASDTHPWNLQAQILADLLYERSNGRMNITIHGSSQLGGARTLVEQVKLGTLDFESDSTIGMGPFTNVAHGFSLPFLFDSSDPGFLFFNVCLGSIGQKVLDAFEPSFGVKGISYTNYDFRDIYTTKKPIKTLQDMKGLKFRVIEDPLQLSIFRALGTAPTPIPFAEVYTAMQTGVIDGFEGNWTGLYAMKQHEVTKYVTTFGHHNCQGVMIMALKTFNSLSKADQKLVLDTARDASVIGYYEVQALKERAKKACLEYGVKLAPRPEMEPFKKAVEPVIQEYMAKDPIVKEFVEEVRQLRALKEKRMLKPGTFYPQYAGHK